ncbi:MAG TPA: 3-methyladenine DNA glycosylase [Motilibacteraceae bacterium]|nr:3-methyladenine DNA glycosylase [Motilibacteraceae bacterium]
MDGQRLSEDAWRARRAAHEARVDAWTGPHLERARRGQKHPVEDFLFTYYSFRPAQLRRWSPGVGVVCEGAAELLGQTGWTAVDGGAVVGPAPEGRLRTATWVADLLRATAARPAHLGCLGLHEWAMVYRQPPEQVRHAAVPLRLGAAGTDAVVEALPVRCSHFDAFRFFTDPARPRNALQPTRDSQLALEQPGCLHATMDLYKWAYKLWPWVPSELVADCFALARKVRELDMRASPYDLSEHGYEPVRIETAEGRAEYVATQRSFSERGVGLRARLLDAVEAVLAGGVGTITVP